MPSTALPCQLALDYAAGLLCATLYALQRSLAADDVKVETYCYCYQSIVCI